MSSSNYGLPGDVTRVLERIDGGDRNAMADLLPIVYAELRAIAAAHMATERPDHTLQPTALVHEAYVRLAHKQNPNWNDRKHFYRTAAVVMRLILVNHARDRRRRKRGGGAQHVAWDDQVGAGQDGVDMIALDEALERLTAIDPRQTEVIELRFFAGLTIPEVADVLGVSERTVEADWSLARAWLLRELDPG